jgi:hypothetical protein
MMRLFPIFARAAVVAIATVPAMASAAPAPSPVLVRLESCRSISDASARLACFDRESAALVSAVHTGNVAVVDQGQMREARRSLFGFQMPKLPFFAGDKSADTASDQLESTVRSVEGIGRDRYRVTIADGAVWETIDSPMRLAEPRPGNRIVIKKASLGSYFLRFDGQLGVKGRRVK